MCTRTDDASEEINLRKLLPTTLARCIGAHPLVTTTNTLHIVVAIDVHAIQAIDGRPNRGIRDGVDLPRTTAPRASQLHALALPLELDTFF